MAKQYHVKLNSPARKGVETLDEDEKILFDALAKELRDQGPKRSNWPNYSKLGKTTFHCHLNYRWVACWRCAKGEIIIEVYYVGSREGAPY